MNRLLRWWRLRDTETWVQVRSMTRYDIHYRVSDGRWWERVR